MEGEITNLKYSVRSFIRTEIENCVDLYIKVFNSQPWNEEWSYDIAKERLTDLYNTPKFLGLTLYRGRELVGFIGGNKKRTPQGIVFYIAELCINNDIQGKGLGSLLLESLEEQLQENKVSSIYLITSNGGLAERFYIKKDYEMNENRIIMKKTFN
ncbi:GNAT family N-acetyltransferase [Gracilibacillus salitolerans]|uniref:GNAT family N-acetyltransferase n=1 Tax=Gracilibacillus salitolerans TaxID=2663022 RepID=A0A5Q2TDV5_9BACI|nr:GNAT family N-acetyltransferase [Gracilibacillus salitolerans]QGH32786.1 GNAT family N-acetyltransferase [Gracilibacillus salitolerans]